MYSNLHLFACLFSAMFCGNHSSNSGVCLSCSCIILFSSLQWGLDHYSEFLPSMILLLGGWCVTSIRSHNTYPLIVLVSPAPFAFIMFSSTQVKLSIHLLGLLLGPYKHRIYSNIIWIHSKQQAYGSFSTLGSCYFAFPWCRESVACNGALPYYLVIISCFLVWQNFSLNMVPIFNDTRLWVSATR